jgi:hypothetical protein
MQNRGTTAPAGVVYNTAMNRPDAALALAALSALENRRESRTGAVCVVGSGLKAAIFCDIVARFFTGPAQAGNQQLAVGLAAADPLPPDPAMVVAAVDRKNQKGEPQYSRSIRRLADTSQAEAVIRNGVIFNASAVMVLSAPATYLAKTLGLPGVFDLFKARVRRLVVVEAGAAGQDAAAFRKVLSDFPSPIYFLGKEQGESLMFPGSRIEKDFSWAPAHPVVDAYRASRPMPYDAPAHDLAAIHFAVRPESGFFQESGSGTLAVGDDGSLRFTTSSNGKVKSLSVDPAKRSELMEALIALASSQPRK